MPPTKRAPAKKAARKTPARQTALSTVPQEPDITEPVEDRTGRFYELQREIAAPDCYVLTPDIVLPPMTRRRLREIAAAKNDAQVAQIMIGDLGPAIEALYEDRPISEYSAMLRDVFAFYFGRGATDLPGGSQGS